MIATDESHGEKVHMLALDYTLYALSVANLRLNVKKSNFITQSIVFLGEKIYSGRNVTSFALSRGISCPGVVPVPEWNVSAGWEQLVISVNTYQPSPQLHSLSCS